MNQQDIINALEELTDKNSLFTVVMCLSLMCDEKAEHIICTWQDKHTAKPWSKAAKKLVAIARDTSI